MDNQETKKWLSLCRNLTKIHFRGHDFRILNRILCQIQFSINYQVVSILVYSSEIITRAQSRGTDILLARTPEMSLIWLGDFLNGTRHALGRERCCLLSTWYFIMKRSTLTYTVFVGNALYCERNQIADNIDKTSTY